MKNFKPIIGFIVTSKYGVTGYCYGPKDESDILWVGGTYFAGTIFKSRKEARSAVERTEAYALDHGMNLDGPWFGHIITKVRFA